MIEIDERNHLTVIYAREFMEGKKAYEAGISLLKNPYAVIDSESYVQIAIWSSWVLGWTTAHIQERASFFLKLKPNSFN